MKHVITLTMNPAIDINTTVQNVAPEQKLRSGPLHYEPGGGGINVSRAIKKIGGKSVALYPRGGSTGRMLRDLLDREGLQQQAVQIEKWTRQNFIVLEESSNQQYRFGTPGPELKESEWQKCLDDLSKVDPKPAYLVASGSLPPGVPEDFYARVVAIGNKLGSRVVMDTSGAPYRKALQEGVFLIKPNLRELRLLVDRDLHNESEQEEAAMELVRSGKSRVVVVSIGAAGAFVATDEGIERMRAPTVTIRSKVGAGDSMVGGIVFSLANEKSVREASLFGLAAGSAAVMTPGTELCRRDDVIRLYDQMSSQLKHG